MRFDVDTRASPDQVLRALTDFSDRRPLIWHLTLDPKRYEVREVGDTWAVAREATAPYPFWVVARYDWSDPAMVRWTLVESSYGGGGTGTVRMTPTGDGGTRLHVEWDAVGGYRLQRPALRLIHTRPMGRYIARKWATQLDQFARDDDAGRATLGG